MRDVRFKGKRKDNGEWVEGNLLTLSNKRAFIITFNVRDLMFRFWTTLTSIFDFACEVDPATVCEYTGLKDKNGKEIWEGDKIKAETGDESASIFVGIVQFWQSELEWRINSCNVDWSNWQLEVIGNIFDNPELLKEK